MFPTQWIKLLRRLKDNGSSAPFFRFFSFWMHFVWCILRWLNEFHLRVVGSFSVSCRLVLVLFRISGLGHKQPHKITPQATFK